MRFAWGCSIAAQLWLIVALWRAGQRDWWLVYLAWGTIRSAAGWTLGQSTAFHWYWIVTEPIDMGIRFAAVWQVAALGRPGWVKTGLVLAALFCAVTTGPQPNLPLSLRAVMLMQALGAYLAGGVCLALAAGGAAVPVAMFGYLVLDLLHAFALRYSPHVGAVETSYLWALTGFCCVMAITKTIYLEGRRK